MIVGRVIGWVLLLAGLVVLARDAIGWIDTHVFSPIALGQLWFDLSPGSLNFVQAVIQRYIHPAVWDPAITSVLFLWAWAVFVVLGVVLLALFRRRNGRWRRRRR
jgi:hypothetical protein